MLYLDVPYLEKDEAKALGAKWNPNLKKWYVEDGKKYFDFRKWFNIKETNIICESLYLVETNAVCWKCGKPIKIVCLASDKFYTECYGDSSTCNTRLTLFGFLTKCPNYLEELLKEYNCTYNYSRQFDKLYEHRNNGCYLVNKCSNCNMIQGDNFLHELNNPRRGFYQCIDYQDTNLKLHKLVNLQGTIELTGFMHSDDIFAHMQTGIENLASIDTDKYILEQAFKDEIDITKYLK